MFFSIHPSSFSAQISSRTRSLSCASIGYAALPRPEIFGEQRVWGTIGFGLSAFSASRLYAFFNTDFVYIVMFAITTILCVILTCFIRIPEKANASAAANHEQEEMIDVTTGASTEEINNRPDKRRRAYQPRFKAAALIPLLKRVDVLVFLSLTFIWGISYAALDPVNHFLICLSTSDRKGKSSSSSFRFAVFVSLRR